MDGSAVLPELNAVSRLLANQRAAFAAKGVPDLAARLGALQRLQAAVLANQAAFARAISADFGNRPSAETEMLEILPTVNAIRHARKHLWRWMRPERRRVALTFQPAKAWVAYQPLGVVGVIAPWNYPLFLAVSPLADALAAGNRVMIKPSEYTPALSALLQQVVAGVFDATEVAVVTGGPEVAASFSSLPFDHLLFTGSTAVGRKVMQAASANLTPVTLELGGKSPVIVADDYDIGKAARAIAFGKFLNAGQTCIAPDYVLVPDAKLRALADAVLAEARKMYPTVAANPDYASVISPRHYQRLAAAVAAAEAAGATVLRHEDAGAEGARKLGPTLVIGAPEDSLLMQEEIFGPVLPLVGYSDLAATIAYVNARQRPLALYCLTADTKVEADVLGQTISGGVTVNGTLLHAAQDTLPFGGVGPSGIGAYHGQDGFKRFSHARAVYKIGFINGMDMLRPPYGRIARLMRRALIGS
jgi:coniferyl-aldehyde dehydrogenase